jgi:hypothetical protein
VRRIVLSSLSAAWITAATAGCSSSGSTPASPFGGPFRSSAPAIGQVVAPETTAGPSATADLGKPIVQGALSITVSGPITVTKDGDTGPGLSVVFHVTMSNVGKSGDVIGPDSFGVRCDANRDDRGPGDFWSSSTVPQDKHIPAGKTITGIADLAWVAWDSSVKCTGPTTVEARFLGGAFESWTLPADEVAKANAVSVSVAATPAS